MKVLVQWSYRNPQDWEEVEARDWASTPFRAQPSSNGRHGGRDNLPGWINDLNVQGVHFNGQDHIAVESIIIGNEEGVRVTAWNDDPEDWPVGERSAHIWTFLPLAPDPNLGGAINTRQFQLIYAEGERFEKLENNIPQNTSLRPWSEFVPPDNAIVRHGVWLEDDKWEDHRRASNSFQNSRDEIGWRHWCEHLPESEVELDGHNRKVLKEQRKQGRYRIPSHTKTYYLRDTNLAQGWVSATNENALDTSPGTGQTESVTANSATVVGWAFASPSNEPGSASWPTATYHSQLDCTAASSGLIYYHQPNLVFQQHYLLAVSSDLSSTVDVSDTVSSTFSGTGLKSMSYSWTSPPTSTGDRFVVPVAATGDSHGDAITLRFSSDAYADGPWSTGMSATGSPALSQLNASGSASHIQSATGTSTLPKSTALGSAIHAGSPEAIGSPALPKLSAQLTRDIEFVNATQGFNTTLVEPTNTQEGDTLILLLNAVSPVPPTGWTQIGSSVNESGFADEASIWYVVRGASPPDLTWSYASFNGWAMAAYRNVLGIGNSAGDPTDISPSVNVSSVKDWLVSLYARTTSGGTAPDHPAGMTLRTPDTDLRCHIADEIPGVGATGTRAWTESNLYNGTFSLVLLGAIANAKIEQIASGTVLLQQLQMLATAILTQSASGTPTLPKLTVASSGARRPVITDVTPDTAFSTNSVVIDGGGFD